MQFEEIMDRLMELSDPMAVKGMGRYGINTDRNLGVSVTTIRKIAKEIGTNHELAKRLWQTGIRDARLLAACIDDPERVTEAQMERWVREFNSWDICDHCCGHLFDKTKFAYKKAMEWSAREEEFVKRAGFALMAWLALHDKKNEDIVFYPFLPLIKRESTDSRRYVKKAVNWALRTIGKRSLNLNNKAIEIAKKIKEINSKAAKWIATDALRELTSDAIQQRLRRT